MVRSPGHHDEEIHDIPDIAQIGATVEDEAKGEDLEARLDAENPEEVDFCGLELLREYGFVLLRQVLLEGEDHAIGDDGEQDGVLEGRPFDYEASVLSDAVILRQDKQRRSALATSPTATRPSALIPAWRHVHQTRYLFTISFHLIFSYPLSYPLSHPFLDVLRTLQTQRHQSCSAIFSCWSVSVSIVSRFPQAVAQIVRTRADSKRE